MQSPSIGETHDDIRDVCGNTDQRGGYRGELRIPVDVAVVESTSYSFYEEYQLKWKEYDSLLNEHNEQVTQLNQGVDEYEEAVEAYEEALKAYNDEVEDYNLYYPMYEQAKSIPPGWTGHDNSFEIEVIFSAKYGRNFEEAEEYLEEQGQVLEEQSEALQEQYDELEEWAEDLEQMSRELNQSREELGDGPYELIGVVEDVNIHW